MIAGQKLSDWNSVFKFPLRGERLLWLPSSFGCRLVHLLAFISMYLYWLGESVMSKGHHFKLLETKMLTVSLFNSRLQNRRSWTSGRSHVCTFFMYSLFSVYLCTAFSCNTGHGIICRKIKPKQAFSFHHKECCKGGMWRQVGISILYIMM